MGSPVILNGSGQFKKWDRPPAEPGVDVILSKTGGPVFDLGVDLEFFSGKVYIREEHVHALANSMGYLSPEQAHDLREENARLLAEVENLPSEIEEFKNGLSALVTDFKDRLDSRTDLPVEDSAGEPEIPSGEFKVDSGISGTSSEGTGEGKRPVGVKGPNDVPSNPVDGFGFGL